MVEKIKLYQLAHKLIIKQENQEQEQIDLEYIFEYNNSKWCLEYNLFPHAQSIKDLLQTCKALNLNSLVVEEKQELNIVFKNELRRTRQNEYEVTSILSQFFRIIFSNYEVNNDVYFQLLQYITTHGNISSSTTLITSYVTTQLYDALYEAHARALPPNTDLEPLELPASFLPKLYKFQKRTIHWLLQQEQNVKYLPNFWLELLPCVAGSNKLYKHKYCMLLQKSTPQPVELPKGGILADEMGLGKTVEILALIILHPRTLNPHTINKMLAKKSLASAAVQDKRKKQIFCICNINTPNKKDLIECSRCRRWQHEDCVNELNSFNNSLYCCPECWYELTADQPIPTRATIIISPNSIRTQWLSEVKRHSPNLRVFSFDAQTWINPKDLGDYDIVLTDYQVLLREFYHTVDFVSERKTRHVARGMRRLTPLLMLHWYRVCLDEAQMIDRNISRAADLAHKLPAVHRWAVTGTPITCGIDDLKPLLKFIGLWEIWNPPAVWETLAHNYLLSCNNTTQDSSNIVRQPPLIEILQTCMRRTCKKNIANELEIPSQEERVHFINLMDLEKLNYMEQHVRQESEFSRMIQKYAAENKWGLRLISPKTLKIILNPLQKIRQCCTIATIADNPRNGNIFDNNRHFLQPSELMEHMKSVNEVECKGALRTMASSYNGMAAVQFILENYGEAIIYYEQVLKLASDHNNNNISVDSLLQIHAIYNLLEANKALLAKAANNDKILDAKDVTKYEEQLSNMKKKYLLSYEESLANVKKNYDKNKQVLRTNSEQNIIEDAAQLIKSLDPEQSDILLSKVYYECRVLYPNSIKYENLQSFNSLLLLLNYWQEKLNSKRLQLMKTLDSLDFFTKKNIAPNPIVSLKNFKEIMDLVRSVYSCHLSEIRDSKGQSNKEKQAPPPAKKLKQTKCILCECDTLLDAYSCLVYDKSMENEDDKRVGTERSAIEVHLLRTIFNFFRTKCKSQDFRERVNANLETLDALQNFYNRTSKFWIEIEYNVKAYDELDMCKMRITLTDNEEEKSNFRVLDYELDELFETQQIQLNAAQVLFARKYARLKYLQHLGDNTDHGPCPVCCAELNLRYAVLECGHHLCLQCLKYIKKRSKFNQLDCALCRNKQFALNVFYVTKNISINADKRENFETRGIYSSKISYILRLLMELQQTDKSVKVLVFSQWKPILMAIAEALKKNDITFRIQRNAKNIEDFKNPKLKIMCLLMPLHNGSKGLNLIEATHVFLLEPILNPGEEQQALGRVHRLGQTKPTIVHRFIVSNTIEENIYNVTRKNKNTQGREYEDMTLQDIEQLFVLKNDVSDQQL